MLLTGTDAQPGKNQTPLKGVLGTTTNNVSPYRDVRRKRYRLQSVAQQLLQGWRVGVCMRELKGQTVAVMHNSQDGYAYYDGPMVCGSVWTCPVCAARISEERRQELKVAAERKGFSKVLVTFTLQHSREDKLEELLAALNDSVRRLKMGKWWQSMREDFGLVAYATSLEITYGLSAGFHPHKHMLIFSELPEGDFDVEYFKTRLVSKWQSLLDKHGRYASEVYGIDVQVGDRQVGNYVSKWGVIEEVTKTPVKNGRNGGYSPFQLLELYSQGEEWAAPVFKEYALATTGKRQLSKSRGFNEVLGLGEEEDMAEEEPGELDVVLVRLSKVQWQRVVRLGLRSELLDVSDSGSVLEVVGFLEEKGVLGSEPELQFA